MTVLLRYPEPSREVSARKLRPDARWIDSHYGTWLVELAPGPGLRDLRAKLLDSAVMLDREPSSVRALCVITSEKVTMERLLADLELVRHVLRPSVAERVHVGRCTKTGANVLLEPGVPPELEHVVANVQQQQALKRRRAPGGTQLDVFAFLMRAWMNHRSPLMVKDIQEAVGASYPTVGSVIEQLGKQGVLERTSDRRVRLSQFPSGEWANWLVSSMKARQIAKFVDPSGHARGPNEMAARLTKATKKRVAISGVVGASKHYPDLNITDAPRLDLSVAGAQDLSWVAKLDAGLVRDDDAPYPALAVHFLPPRADRTFMNVDGQLWADPLECVVTLYEAKLNEQGEDMLQHLIGLRSATNE